MSAEDVIVGMTSSPVEMFSQTGQSMLWQCVQKPVGEWPHRDPKPSFNRSG